MSNTSPQARASRKPIHWIAAAVMLITSPVFAQDFPTVAPKLQPLMDAATGEYNAARSNFAQRFTWPAGAGAAMPCEGVTQELHRLGGVVRQDDEATKKIYARISRQMGMLPGAVKPPEFRAKQLHIVRAQCKDGKLDGDIEAWLDYDMIMDDATAAMVTSFRSHSKARYAAGKALPDMQVTARSQSATKTTYKDPATEKMMAAVKTPSISVANFTAESSAGNVIVMYMAMDGKSKLSTTVADVLSPPPKLRVKMMMYQRATLISESQMRDGQQHGWMVMHPHTDTLFGVAIPASKTCFDDGETIKSNTCDVD